MVKCPAQFGGGEVLSVSHQLLTYPGRKTRIRRWAVRGRKGVREVRCEGSPRSGFPAELTGYLGSQHQHGISMATSRINLFDLFICHRWLFFCLLAEFQGNQGDVASHNCFHCTMTFSEGRSDMWEIFFPVGYYTDLLV